MDYASALREPAWLRERASNVLRVPGRGVEPHDDHMHVRIACSADDIAFGRCENQAAPRRKRFFGRVTCPMDTRVAQRR